MKLDSIILLLGIVIFFCTLQIRKTVENMEDHNYVVLLGDSIFQNKKYVKPKNSVEYRLKNKINSMVLAQDNSMIKDISVQYEDLPKKLDNSNTYLFISVGGNDLLEIYKYGNMEVDNHEPLDFIFELYKKEVNKLRKKTNCTMILTDLYYITDPEYKKFYPIIKKWNKNLYSFSKEKNIEVYKISNLVKTPSHFTNSIEPSSIGSRIIVDNIINF